MNATTIVRPTAQRSEEARARPDPQDRFSGALRVTAHLAIWSVILVPTIVNTVRGWRPLGDFAAISEQAFSVLSIHTPLVGQLTQYSTVNNHPVFDLGPLEYWLLALPVRADPGVGAIWGAALCCGAIFSVAIEAAWSRFRQIGCLIVALVVLDLAWTTPSMFTQLLWNPYFGLVFFIATVILAWVVASGDLRWWPVLVLSASVAAQSHLIFALIAPVLVVVSPLLGLRQSDRRMSAHWLATGVVIGAICWILPIGQQLLGSPGNIYMILRGGGDAGTTIGFSTGFEAIGRAVGWPPLSLTHAPSNFFIVLADISGRSSFFGVIVLALFAAAGLVARRIKHRNLGMLSLMGFITSLGFALTLGHLPKQSVITLDYLVVILWLVAGLLWIVVIWALVEMALVMIRARRSTQESTEVDKGSLRTRSWATGLIAAPMIAALVVMAALAMPSFAPESTYAVNRSSVREADQIAAGVQYLLPPGPVALHFVAPGLSTLNFLTITVGAGYQLTTVNYQTGVFVPETVPGLARNPKITRQWPKILVRMKNGRVQVVEHVKGPPRHRVIIASWRPPAGS